MTSVEKIIFYAISVVWYVFGKASPELTWKVLRRTGWKIDKKLVNYTFAKLLSSGRLSAGRDGVRLAHLPRSAFRNIPLETRAIIQKAAYEEFKEGGGIDATYDDVDLEARLVELQS